MAQEKKLVALGPIMIGGALGYTRGDIVHEDVVNNYDLQDAVASDGTKAGRQALGLEDDPATEAADSSVPAPTTR
jgi:hypothetical protein